MSGGAVIRCAFIAAVFVVMFPVSLLAFFDGDSAQLPAAMLKKATSL